MNRSALAILFAFTMWACGPAAAQAVYTFTPAGATGTTGPNQTMIDAAYAGTSLDGDVTVVGGIQFWTVPETGPYQVEAFGGQGYGDFGGRGAHISGEFNFTAGQQLKILVGQLAPPYLAFPATTYNHQFGGGGGSFITLTDNTPLVIAGGGGGSHAASYLAGSDGQITESGAAGALGATIGAGGINGLGGQQASSADAGAGLLGDGDGIAGGKAFVNGGEGGFDEGFGGFGGGGGTSSWNNYRGGGGGGYSGGGTGNNGGSCCAAGGGGGSFNAGTNPVNLAGVQLGDGMVRITQLNPPPVFGKAFSPALIAAGSVSTLTFSLDHSAGFEDATAMAFVDTLPAGMVVATPANGSNTCGGTLTAAVGSGSISLSGGALLVGASCSIDVDITAATPGLYNNVSGDLTSSVGNSGPASASLTVIAPPLFDKSFAPDTTPAGVAVTLSFVIDNTANVVDASAMGFTDNLPAGVMIATPGNAANTCGGTLGAVDGGAAISLSGGMVAAGATCQIDVDVLAASPGAYVNTSGDLASSLGNSGAASDTLTVVAPPLFDKSFASASAAAGQSVTLTFTVDNSANPLTATSLAFADNLPAGMLVATPSNASSNCAGAVTAAAGSSTISFAGGSVAAAASCTVSADTVAAAPGVYDNISTDLTSSLGNSGTASDSLTIASAPLFGKSFATASAAVSASVTLTFAIDNSANPIAASGLSFTDNLPAGMVVATPANSASSCAGTISAVAGSVVIGFSGGSVAAGASCTVSADVSAGSEGVYNNTSGDLTSNLGNSGTASDSLTVTSAPLFAKSFAIDTVGPGAAVSLTFSIDNSTNPVQADTLAFADTFPAGMVVATPANVSNSCGGTVNAPAGAASVSVSGGSVAASASCAISVDVSATVPGVYDNISGDLTSSLGNSGTASDSLTVASAPLFSISFSPRGVVPGGLVRLSYVIDNTANAVAATGLAFNNTLPVNLTVAAPPNSTNGCGGTLSATAGSGVISLVDGVVAGGAACTIEVDILVSASSSPGTTINNAGSVSTSLGSSPGAATASIGVNQVLSIPTLSLSGLAFLLMVLLSAAALVLRRNVS